MIPKLGKYTKGKGLQSSHYHITSVIRGPLILEHHLSFPDIDIDLVIGLPDLLNKITETLSEI